MQYEPLTVCIPAYEEEACISACLESVLAQQQDYPGELEIIVGVTPGKDRTEEILKVYETKKTIRTVTTTKRGKAPIWNKLRESANHNTIIFTDADTAHDRFAFKHMYEKLKTDEVAAVGAYIEPYLPNGNRYSRMFAVPLKSDQNLVIGLLYMFDNKKLTTIFQERLKLIGNNTLHNTMPEGILVEDAFFSLIVGEENWSLEPRAKVFYNPYPVTDIPKISIRDNIGKLQLQREYRSLFMPPQGKMRSYLTTDAFERKTATQNDEKSSTKQRIKNLLNRTPRETIYFLERKLIHKFYISPQRRRLQTRALSEVENTGNWVAQWCESKRKKPIPYRELPGYINS